MSYKLRDQRPGYHHVVTRGNNKQTIYLNNSDRESFLILLDRVARRYDWDVLTYCLMRNHYHLVLRIGEAGLARGMCELNSIYALYFNTQHGRINHLFGRRYWSELTRTEAHLMNAVRYVVQNPRRAGVAGPLESHRWTSYAASIGQAFAISRFARNDLLEMFGRTPQQAITEFIAFCNEPAPPRGEDERQPTARKRVVIAT